MMELVVIIPAYSKFIFFVLHYTCRIYSIKLLLKPGNGFKRIILHFYQALNIYVFTSDNVGIYKNNFVALESAKCCFCLTQEDDDHFCKVFYTNDPTKIGVPSLEAIHCDRD